MPLDRNAVERAAGRHIQAVTQHGHVTAKQKRDIRKMHEQIAAKVAAKRRKHNAR